MNLTNYERETTILYNQAEDTAKIYTCDPKMIRRLDRIASQSKAITVVAQDDVSKTYVCPKKFIKVSAPKQLSDEKRAELSRRAKERFGRGENA